MAFSLLTLSPDIVAAQDEIQVIRGNTITITVTILQNGSYGYPVQYQRIYFFDQTNNTLLGSDISNQDGVASLDWKIPLSHTLGATIINATFYGNDSLLLAPSYQRVSLLVFSQTRIEIDQIPETLELGDMLSLDIHLVDDSNSSIANAELAIFKDTMLLATGTTNLSGIANLYTTIDERFALGMHILRICYNGSEHYTQSTLEKTIVISSPITITTRFPEIVEIGSNLPIEITITDVFNRFIPNSILSIFDTTSDQRYSSPIDDTVIDFQYIPQGPPGTHTLIIEVTDNPYISNNSLTMNFTFWSRPEIILLNTGVEHYASPNQELTFEIWLIDWEGNCSLRHLQLMINNETYSSSITDIKGEAFLTFTAPATEAQYNISIVYNGNTSRYELGTKYDYNLFVTQVMPIRIDLDSYEVIAAFHELSMKLTVRGLNGSLLNGVILRFSWLSANITSESLDNGLIILHLAVPTVSGEYTLYYESESTRFTASTRGSIMIEITINDILTTEGIGVTGMIFALLASIGIAAVPILRRRYLVG